MKKLILLLLVSIILVACNTNARVEPSKAMYFGMTSTIEHLNPILTEEGHSELISLVYRGLMKQTEDNDVTGDLAKTFTVSDDGLTYTFTLHKATWHDEHPITADDVVFTLNSIITPETASPYYSDFQSVKNVRAINNETVEITVDQPTPTLLHKLKVGILPKHIYEDQNMMAARENKQPIGNGPYVLESWNAEEVLTFRANTQFYGNKPKIESIVVYTKLDENAKLLRLKTGDLHVAQVTPQQMKTVENYNNMTLKKTQTADYRALQFNQNHAQLQDVNVRRAINHFIDRAQLQQLVLLGTGEQAFGPLQRSFARSDQKIYALNINEGKRLLKAAGYMKTNGYFTKDGQPLSFEIVAPITDPIRTNLATIIVEQLQNQGVDARLQTKDWTNITIEKEDTFMIGWGSEDDPDTHTYRVFHSSEHAPNGYNYALVSNSNMDAALEKAKSGSEEERIVAYEEFQQHLADEMAFSFLLYIDGIYAISKNLEGVGNRTLGHNGFGLLWNIENWYWEDEDV